MIPEQPPDTPMPDALEKQLADARPRFEEPAAQEPDAQAPAGRIGQMQAQAAQALRPLTNTVWSKLDRKATAIAEFTLRQYRTKSSTWVVLGIGLLFVTMVLMFYAEAMAAGFDSYDNDGDSEDWDGDGYPTGQERRYGTSPWNADDHPDPETVPPDPASAWIDEDPLDFDGDFRNSNQGFDDDGDCTGEGWSDPNSPELPSQKDRNGDGHPCNVYYRMNATTGMVYTISGDPNVDEDPNESVFLKEALHRSFLLGFGKVGFTFLLGIFLPLFLATGLVRDEMERGTMHYLLGKPIARAEVLTYRLLGYVTLTWPYVTGLVIISAIVSGLLAPSDGFYRWQDLPIWLGVLVASWMVLLAYGSIFCVCGLVSPKYGVFIAIGLGVWEFLMAMVSLADPTFPLTYLSISHWGIEIINCAALLAYPDFIWMIQVAEFHGFGADIALQAFWSPPSAVQGSALASMVVSLFVLTLYTVFALFIGQAMFKRRELD